MQSADERRAFAACFKQCGPAYDFQLLQHLRRLVPSPHVVVCHVKLTVCDSLANSMQCSSSIENAINDILQTTCDQAGQDAYRRKASDYQPHCILARLSRGPR